MLEYLNGMGHQVKEISPENKLYQNQWHFLWIGLLSFLIVSCGEPKQTVVSGTVSQNQAVKQGTPITLTDEQGLPLAQDCVTDKNGNYRCLVPRLQTTRVMRLQSEGATPMDSLIVKQKVPTSEITRHINPITNFIANPSRIQPKGRHMRTGSSHQQTTFMNLEGKVAAYEAQAKRVSEGLGVKADSFASSAAFKPRVADDPNSGSVASDLLEVIAEQKSGRTLSPRVIGGVLDSKAIHIVEPVTQVRLASAALGRSESKVEGVAKEFSEIVTSNTNENTKKAFQGVVNAFGTVKARANNKDKSSRTAESNNLLQVALDSVEVALVETLTGDNKEIVDIKTTKDTEDSKKLVNLAKNMTTLLKDPVAEAVEETANEGKLGYNAMKLLVSGAAINAASVALAANLTEKESQPTNVANIIKNAFERSETVLKENLEKNPSVDSAKELSNVALQSQKELHKIHLEEYRKINALANIRPPKIIEGLPGRLPTAMCPFVMDSPPNPAEVTAIDCSDETLTQTSLDLTAYIQLERLILGNQQLTSIQGLNGLKQLQYLNASHAGLSSLPDLSNLEQLTYLDWGENGLQGTLDGNNLPSSLIQLHLADNNLRELSNLDHLTNLTELNVASNDFQNIPVLSSLPKLAILNLQNSKFPPNTPLTPNHLPRSLIELNLANNGLGFQILTHLTKLTKLDLAKNQWRNFQGLPSSLTELDLSENHFNGANPTVGLNNLTNLAKLNLANTNNSGFSGILNVGALRKLTELNLADNNLTQIQGLDNLTQLAELDLNVFGNEIFCGSLPNFSSKDGSGCRNYYPTAICPFTPNGQQLSPLPTFEGQPLIPTQIQKITCNNVITATNLSLDQYVNLTSLDLANNQLSTLDVSNLTKLTTLNVADNNLTQIQGLNSLTQLTNLNLTDNELSGTLDISNLINLNELNVANQTGTTKLTQIDGLNNLTQLNELDLNVSGNEMFCDSLPDFSSKDGSGCRNYYPTAICPFTSNGQQLSPLPTFEGQPLIPTQIQKITCNNVITARTLSLDQYVNLTSLDLGENQLSTLDVSKLTQLTTLNVADNNLTQITGLNRLRELTELNLANNSLHGTLDVSNLTQLTTLNVADNNLTQITGLNSLTQLTNLNLRNTKIFCNTLGNLRGKASSGCRNYYPTAICPFTSNGQQRSPLPTFEGQSLIPAQIQKINCSNNVRTARTLSLDQYVNLTYLDLGVNQLSTLDVSKLTKLTKLELWNNRLTQIVGLNKLIELTYLGLGDNQLSGSLDVSNLKKLTELHLQNNLQLENIGKIVHPNSTTLKFPGLIKLNLSGTNVICNSLVNFFPSWSLLLGGTYNFPSKFQNPTTSIGCK